ncbi:MAG TPA: glutamate cyclase domain-containing protein, partial [Nitrososphaerales archaeon]|nr:glutamate cyclase domain-containing protein [Nitrososphaerales archaeon]
GFIVPPWLAPETDGPVGAVSLARSLNFALNLVPIIVTEKSSVEKMSLLLEAAGFRVREFDNLGNVPRRAAVLPFTLDPQEAKSDAERLIRMTNPSSTIAIEKASPNRAGVFHSGVGVDVSPLCAKVDALIEFAKSSGVPTIGIGDAGNEIGMGCIEEEVRKLLPTGNDCGCPCHLGVASSIKTDSLIVAGTSNWGAPAIEALLAFHLKARELLHDARFEEYLIERAGALGFINPASGFGESGVDGIPASVHGSLINVLNFVVSSRMSESFTIRHYREFTKDRAKIQKDISDEAKSA